MAMAKMKMESAYSALEAVMSRSRPSASMLLDMSVTPKAASMLQGTARDPNHKNLSDPLVASIIETTNSHVAAMSIHRMLTRSCFFVRNVDEVSFLTDIVPVPSLHPSSLSALN